MNKRLLVGLVILLVVVVGGYALYSYRRQSAATKMTEENVEIKIFKYTPNTLTVKSGQVVSVTNRDAAKHTLTSDAEGSFDTGLIAKDETKTFNAPTEAGSYSFHCTSHPSIVGTLVVEK